MQLGKKLLIRAATNLGAALAVAMMLTAIPQPASAGKGAAFVGGLIGGHVLTNMASRSERRTEAAEYQAYSRPPAQQAPAQAPAQAQSSSQTVKQRLNTLDQLAAGGYISKEEYKKRRQAILDSM
jgi:hypothetical protein